MTHRICILLLFSYLFLLKAHPFKHVFDDQHTIVGYLYDHQDQSWDNPLAAFEDAAITMEYFLDAVRSENKPIIIRVPADINHVSTLSDNACYTEGARVTMAWASAFARFESLGHLDIRILLTPQGVSRRWLAHEIEQILAQDARTYSTIYQRVHTVTQTEPIDYQPKIEITDFSFQKEEIQPVIYTPQLRPQKTGQLRYLITGGAGFIGSHLSKRLMQQGHQVIAIDNFSCCTKANIDSLLDSPDFYCINADVTQPFDITLPVDCVIHLASIPSPKYYYAQPRQTLRTGLIGTKNTLDVAIGHNARYVFASTSEVYGDPEVSPQPESYCGNVDPIGMRSQYDQSKRGAETMIQLYAHHHAIDARIARIFNTYGPGMQLDDGRVITNFVQAYLTGSPFVIHGTGNQTRSFAYVSDTVEGLYKLITNEQLTEIEELDKKLFNIGTPEEHTINELAELFNTVLADMGKQPVEITHIPHFDPTDPKKRLPDISRAQNVLGFEPTTDCKIGLKKMIE